MNIVQTNRFKIYLLFTICVFQFTAYGQDIDLADNSSVDRFNHKEYDSFREYMAKNGIFPPEAFDNTGVLLAGMVLDNNGEISQVFSFNSLA